MAKHRKNRRNRGKRQNKRPDESPGNDNVELKTPLRTPVTFLNNDGRSPIKTTPVNKRRSLTRKTDARLNGTWNVTNLNRLFDFEDSPATAVHKSTQTNNSSEVEMGDTPKTSHIAYSNKTLNNRSKKLTKFTVNEVNVNPYVKNKDLRWPSTEEASFFSPQLFEMKSSSTPIQDNKILSVLRENLDDSLSLGNQDNTLRSEKVENKDRSVDLGKFNRMDVNVNTPVSEKIIDKDHSLPSLVLNKKRIFKKSPKVHKVLNGSVSYLKLNATRRWPLDSVPLRLGVCERIMARIKRYGRVSAQWSVKLIEACSRLGLHIKNRLSPLCKLDGAEPKHECKCQEYKEEIESLSTKIDILKVDFANVKNQLDRCVASNREIDNLKVELTQVKQELNQFKDIRSDLSSLKQQIGCLKSCPESTVPIPPPPPPSLPPPPPPPMPTIKTAPKLVIKSRGKVNDAKESRPVISLDDILKVKLKKASDRNGSSTPAARPSVEPVSLDTLRQVKLRPASRPFLQSTEATLTPKTDTSSMSTSPHSSLCRMLNGDVGSWRLKRLRKVGGYSLDCVHRHTRERNCS